MAPLSLRQGPAATGAPGARARPGPSPALAAMASASPRRLRIALYYPWLYLTSGAERTILEIARSSRHSITVFTNEYQPQSTFPELRDVDVRVLDPVPVERSLRAVARAAVRILRQRIDLSGFDALVIVSEGLGDLMALRHGKIPAFCLCLTPLRIAFDPIYRRVDLDRRGPAVRLPILLGAMLFRVVDRLAWRRYRRVFPISAEVGRRILAGRLAPPERLQILHPGVDLTAYAPSRLADRTFFLPGRIMWTKNLELGIAAFRLFLSRLADPAGWRLRIAGIVDRKSEPYLQRLRRMAGEDPAIEFLVHPSDVQMREEYRTCFATLFTAFNEDWGLVILESMASRKPVIATNRGGPLEIVRHESNGLLASPDPASFAAAMQRLASDAALRERLADRGPETAARFGWLPFVARLDAAIAADLPLAAGAAVPEALHG
ncbi:MAG TPA: glycosyltransferase family 4 protein [Thermoanaerobaculia bacterium]|nr:glycosyltransferase family 4 protein [Thermoanaerobaculia bacterium]